MLRFAALSLAPAAALFTATLSAGTLPPEADQRLAREIYQQMIEIKSGFTTGATTPVAEAVAARLKAAGFPASDIFLGGAIPTKFNLVVRYHGTGKRRPILLLAHTDVVEAKREDWSMDPFTFIEKDGTSTVAARLTTKPRPPSGSPLWTRFELSRREGLPVRTGITV